jgi:hypothetical protein
MMTTHQAAFALVWIGLFTGHQLADYWLHTDTQAKQKGGPGWPGRLANFRHALTHLAVKAAVLLIIWALIGLRVSLIAAAAGLTVDTVSHYWADRRSTLLWLCEVMDRLYAPSGKVAFYRLGAPRPGHDDNPSMGTGAAHLDQSWHMVWITIAALLIAAV